MAFMTREDVALFTLAGFILNVEEQATLFTSLTIKKDEEKLKNIYLWGKILGVQQDYIIAQSVGESLFDRKYFYTLDGASWFELPDVTPEEAKQAESIQARFSGDLSYEHVVPRNFADPDSTETKLREEKRLAAVVAAINYEVQIVPRGAYYRDMNHTVRLNPEFTGLAKEDLNRVQNYLHFRDGFELTTRTLADRINKYDEELDIFESIDLDQPHGVWSVQSENGGSVALVRSLLWPGYTFLHSPSPLKFTSFYYGTGQKNHNIGFML
eukprot:jgi/Hompol1/5114/HPOL_004191-RA